MKQRDLQQAASVALAVAFVVHLAGEVIGARSLAGRSLCALARRIGRLGISLAGVARPGPIA